MADQHAELKRILSDKNDEAARAAFHGFIRSWEASDRLEEQVAMVEARGGGGWLVPAQPSWIERACTGEDEPRMRLATNIIFVSPFNYKIRGKKLDDGHIINLCSSPHLSNVRLLSTLVSSHFGPRAVAAIADAPTMRLRELNISHSKPGKTGLTALGKGSAVGSLAKLNLGASGVDGKGLEALLKGGALAGLRELDLHRNAIGPQGAAAIARPAALGKLEKLDLSSSEMDDATLEALCAEGALPSLRDLSIGHNERLSAAAMRELAAAPFAARLLRLSAGYVPADASFLAALAAAGPLPLTDLELSRAPLGPQAIDALLGGAFPALTALSLRECDLGDEGALRLAASPLLGRLERLDLSENKLGDRGILALASAPSLASLKHLSASSNPCSLAAWNKLAAAPSLQGEARKSLEDQARYLS